mmetsp:Transcript_26784/g.52581  ORF Transcript_26784/g.52581 Transcript_26784/m.52581 type:complete len:250 (+) Transcript_26784:1777-2526(+)
MDNPRDCVCLHHHVSLCQSDLLQQSGKKVILRDANLLLNVETFDANHGQSVPQNRVDFCLVVERKHEKRTRKVKRNTSKVVVCEDSVLCRIGQVSENPNDLRTMMSLRDLVEFIQIQEGIHHSRFLERRGNASTLSTDIGERVPLQDRRILRTPKRDLHKGTSQGPRDALTHKGCLPIPWRSHNAHDLCLTFWVGHPLTSQLENSLLRMVVPENCLVKILLHSPHVKLDLPGAIREDHRRGHVFSEGNP